MSSCRIATGRAWQVGTRSESYPYRSASRMYTRVWRLVDAQKAVMPMISRPRCVPEYSGSKLALDNRPPGPNCMRNAAGNRSGGV